MAAEISPELQDRLDELERELEVSLHLFSGLSLATMLYKLAFCAVLRLDKSK